jgi:hypothetical protein
MIELQDHATWKAHALVEKWDIDKTLWVCRRTNLLKPQAAHFEALRVRPDDAVEWAGNLLTTAGLTRLMTLLNGAGGQAMTNTATRLVTGNGVGTAAVGDTDVSAAAGSANRWFQIMDATFPSAATNVLTLKSTFASADGNYTWNEWGSDIGTPTVSSSAVVGATLVNHKTSAALGTKASGSSWALTATITIS